MSRLENILRSSVEIMPVADMINSCSNDKVAQAAVACINGQFAERVRSAAHENGLSVGRFVALVVRDYALCANDEAGVDLREKMEGVDQPILEGLRYVVEQALKARNSARAIARLAF